MTLSVKCRELSTHARFSFGSQSSGSVRLLAVHETEYIVLNSPVGYSQIDGNLATMAAAMKLNGTPNDLIQNLNPISIIVLIPIFDNVIYPFLRKKGINFTPIKRIYAGFLVAGLGMWFYTVVRDDSIDSDP